jgi:quercetin dioxygenase-like cupin family protein
MPRVIVIHDADVEWEEASPTWQARYDGDDRGLRFKRLLHHAPAMPNMQRTEYRPHHHEPPHSHPEDEVLFVLSGELFHGREKLTFGDAIYVARDTTYSLRTGEVGASFVRIGLAELSVPPQERQDAKGRT